MAIFRLRVTLRVICTAYLFCNSVDNFSACVLCEIFEIQDFHLEVPQCEQTKHQSNKHHKNALRKEGETKINGPVSTERSLYHLADHTLVASYEGLRTHSGLTHQKLHGFAAWYLNKFATMSCNM